jgi:hypothetical protein
MSRLFKNFSEFLNEWKFTGHWKDERVNLTSEESRIAPLSEKHPYGWSCRRLIKLSDSGNNTKESISLDKFLNLTESDLVTFQQKLSKTLSLYLNSKKLENTSYEIDSHRAVDLKKVAFQVGEEFWSPEFINKDAKGRTHTSNYITAMVKDNEGATIMYRNAFDKDIYDSADADRLRGSSSTSAGQKRTEFFNKFDREEYLRSFFKIKEVYPKDFFLVIPDSPEWENDVVKQANSGIRWKPAFQPTEISPEKKAWMDLFKPDLQSVLDNGSRFAIFTPNGAKIRYVKDAKIADKSITFLQANEKGETIGNWKTVSPEDTVLIAVPREGNERRLGNLPATGTLVKKFKVEKAFLNKDEKGNLRKTIKGALLDMFVIQPDGSVNYSEYS